MKTHRAIFRTIEGGYFEREVDFVSLKMVFPYLGHREFKRKTYHLVGTIEGSPVSDWNYAVYQESIVEKETDV
jgi:hypothetical protein